VRLLTHHNTEHHTMSETMSDTERRAAREQERANARSYAHRYASTEMAIEALEASFGNDTYVKSVSQPNDDGVITVEAYQWGTQHTWHTDTLGDLQIGAGTWLALGTVTNRTAKRRVARWLAEQFA
jgi:hypothetical protein